MKKIITYVFILLISFTLIGLDFNSCYSQNIITEPNTNTQLNKEKGYVKQLESISSQISILASNTLEKISSNQNLNDLMKNSTFIKSQIRSLRLELSEYHKTESGNIEKNPLSLSLLNTLNFYSMSLSYLTGALESNSTPELSYLLQNYYTSKGSGDNMLLWVQNQINK